MSKQHCRNFVKLVRRGFKDLRVLLPEAFKRVWSYIVLFYFSDW